MATLRQVHSDLKEIRYYYAKRDMFESASKCIIESGIVEKVSRYNRAMANAPPRLYEVYYCLYGHVLRRRNLQKSYNATRRSSSGATENSAPIWCNILKKHKEV